MQTFRHSIKYILVFLVTAGLLTGMLVLAATIPQTAIRENARQSAEFLCEGELFGTAVAGAEGSKIDRYADSILLAIAYQYDSEAPLESVMWSAYYFTENRNENENLLEAVTSGKEPNQQYLRYWHGSNAIVRPLLTVLNIRQMYMFFGAVLAVLVVWLLGMLLRKKALVPAAAVALGLVMTGSWFVPFSLEYTWTYLVMLTASILGVKLAYSGKWECMGILFLISGMVTNFLDFLTTETLTLLVPLLLILWVDLRVHPEKPVFDLAKNVGKGTLLWTLGYAGMWMTKWLMAAVVLGENVMPYVAGHIQQRIGGHIGMGLMQAVWEAVLRNVTCLFPAGYGAAGWFAAMALVLFASYIGYVYHKKQIRKDRVLLYLAVGLIPYIRYMVFHNHSYLHCFFTYRAQLATIVALVMILEELTDWRWRSYANAGRRKP